MNDIEELEKRVNNGKAYEQYMVGELYYKGLEVEKDYIKAKKWFEKAAIQGHANAQVYLGVLYYKGLGVEQNYKEARKWFERAAIQGHANAQFYLGYLYENGLGVERDYKRAKEWYAKAAKQGNANALNNLITLHVKLLKVEQENKKTIEFLEIAAKLENRVAQYNLGYLYGKGLGVEQDYKKAKKCYEKAAKQGDANAQTKLGFLYLFGLGTEINYEIAEKLFSRSFNNGNKSIKYYVDIFDELKKREKREIKEIGSIADYIGKEIESDIDGILIKPDKNIYEYAHTLYDIETFNKIKKQLENMLEGIPKVKENRTNELEVFKQICMKIANIVRYDYNAIDQNNKEYYEKEFTSRNMIGALLEGKCICAGYAELLRNMCACQGIECIFVGSYTHAFNQVKIGDNWYYFDLTNCCDSIKCGIPVENFLLSEKEFKAIDDCCVPQKSQYTYKSPYNYNQRKGSSELWEEATKNVGPTSVEAVAKYIGEKGSSYISKETGCL